MNARDREAGKGRRGNIFDELTNFSYSPTSPESWVRLVAQVSVAGSVIVLLKALDGNVCGTAWNFWVPQTWGNPIGCFIRSLVQNVPDDFVSTPTATPNAAGDAVTPPSTGAQQGQ